MSGSVALVSVSGSVVLVSVSAGIVVGMVELPVVDVLVVVLLSVLVVVIVVPPIGRQTLVVHSSPGPQRPWSSHSQIAVPGVQFSAMQMFDGVQTSSGSQAPAKHSQPKLPSSQSPPVAPVSPPVGSLKQPDSSANRVARPTAPSRRVFVVFEAKSICHQG